MRVLLVDDDKSTLTLLGLHLARAGHVVSGAMDTRAAALRLAEEDYDWLIVDGQLGADDGLAFAHSARRLRPRMRVAMISGYYEPADVAGTEVERLFPKPVDLPALLEHLRSPKPPPPPS